MNRTNTIAYKIRIYCKSTLENKYVIFIDNNRPIVHNHCKQLLLNLLVVLGSHNDHLSVASVLLNNKTNELNYGLITQNSGNAIAHNFLEVDDGKLAFFDLEVYKLKSLVLQAVSS